MSRRIERVNQLIKEELGRILAEELDLPRDILLTVMNVETVRDFSLAKIWLSIFPTGKREEIFKIINKEKANIRKILSHKIILKTMPQIKFLIDESEDKREAINDLFKKIENKS